MKDPFEKPAMLECLERALAVSESNGCEPIRVTHGELSALVAAAWELADMRARIAEATASKGGQHVGPSASYHALALRTAAAEKERDELRAANDALKDVVGSAREVTSWDWLRLLCDHKDSETVREDVQRLDGALAALDEAGPGLTPDEYAEASAETHEAAQDAYERGLAAGRTEMRDRVAELEYAVRHPDDPAYTKGREDERAACVADVYDGCGGLLQLAQIRHAVGMRLERGEHVGRVAGDGGTGQG